MSNNNLNNLLREYFHQLKEGCSNIDCQNPFCRNSGQIKTNNLKELTLLAIKLAENESNLCSNFILKNNHQIDDNQIINYELKYNHIDKELFFRDFYIPQLINFEEFIESLSIGTPTILNPNLNFEKFEKAIHYFKEVVDLGYVQQIEEIFENVQNFISDVLYEITPIFLRMLFCSILFLLSSDAGLYQNIQFILRLISKLSKTNQQIFVGWLCFVPNEMFSKALNGLKNLLNILILENLSDLNYIARTQGESSFNLSKDEKFFATINLMNDFNHIFKLFYFANGFESVLFDNNDLILFNGSKRVYSKQFYNYMDSIIDKPFYKVPYSEFYIDVLNSKDFNGDGDHKCFIIDRVENFQRFCFSKYPFFFNPLIKHRKIKLESEIIQHIAGTIRRNGYFGTMLIPVNLKIRVRRNNVVSDALNQLMPQKINLKAHLQVEFIGEPGRDEGGLTKEFFQLICRDLFRPEYGMFVYNEETRQYWISQYSLDNLLEYELIGVVLGLAIYNNTLLNLGFPKCFYRKLCGLPTFVSDFKEINPKMYKGLQELLSYDGGNEEEVFMTYFVYSYMRFGELINVPLKPNGENIIVTKDNKEEYVRLYTDYVMNKSVEVEFQALKKGFSRVFDLVIDENNVLPYIKAVNGDELELIMCGVQEWNISELKTACKYKGYSPTDDIIEWFWDILESLNISEQKKFLFFSTGCDRVPVGGFKNLNFIIQLHKVDLSHLPSSHTCFNVFCLPPYETKHILREKLLKALENSEGYGLV
eukprot:TRINITY_DN2844_c0_g1_i2.p1 TRINITY_DN2844_c0_g1~~TRINITY_DN2844_c0_g1_i2.p1  ORF type:complete len:761 (-),score=199.75 TRINITY_DN2844_c0_g1_i2:2181-4463(-)